MYGNIFYEQLEIKADKPIDKRMYIDSITAANLEAIFDTGAKYSFIDSVLFNRSDKKFYYLSVRNTAADALVPANWLEISSASSSFSLFSNANAYPIASAVYLIDGGSNTIFYLTKSAILAGETPTTNPEKFLQIGSSTGSSVYQKYEHRLNPAVPAGNSTRTFTMNVLAELSNSHYPIVDFYIDLNQTVGTNKSWSKIEPEYVVYVDGGVTKIDVEFHGDLTDIFYDTNNATQNNIIAEIR